MSLEIKHIIPYFEYGLKIQFAFNRNDGKTEERIAELGCIDLMRNVLRLKNGTIIYHNQTLKSIKPILRPLSDLTKEIEVNGEKFVPYQKIESLFDIEDLDKHLNYLVRREDDGNVFISLSKQYEIIKKLLEWHFDIFNLIPQNLAIDINTLTK